MANMFKDKEMLNLTVSNVPGDHFSEVAIMSSPILSSIIINKKRFLQHCVNSIIVKDDTWILIINVCKLKKTPKTTSGGRTLKWV